MRHRPPAIATALLFVLATLAFVVDASAAPVTFRVAVPGNTPASDIVFVAGDFQGWNPGSPSHALTKQLDGRWTIVHDLPAGQAIQFKFTRGDWARVEKGSNGEEIANRALTPQANQTYDFTVANWADLPPSTITGHVESLVIPQFLAGRRLWIYLPPGYATSTRRYPVLYMHDGQNLFDQYTSFAGEWHVDEACEALIGAGEIEPIVVVGIENGPARCTEYTPWPDASVGCGGGGDAYLQAIRDVLIPEINARYRTRTGPANTFMSGSSLGGLITHYAGYTYDSVFGRIAAVSSSIWWSNRMLVTYASARPKPNLTRFYQDMGTIEAGSTTDHNGNGVDDYIDDLRAMRQAALGQGFQEGLDFRSVEAAGHSHNEFYWAQRFPDLLRFLIDPPAALDVPAPPTPRSIALVASPIPARGSVRIEFALPDAGRARLTLLDAGGRRVAELVDGPLPAGRHAFRWEGRAENGRRVRSGIYFARLEVNGRVVSRKIALVD